MPKKIDLTDQTFGDWYVIGEGGRMHGKVMWKCKCKCGTIKEVLGNNLKRGKTKMCPDCYHDGRNDLIKQKNKYTYTSWHAMRSRVLNPNSTYYSYYGGRGITICERWNSFHNFLEDMGPRPEGFTLDRIDVNGNYEPDNCRWATRKEQMDNIRPFITSEMVVAKLTPDDVREIRRIRNETGLSHEKISVMFNVTRKCISGVLNGTTWKDVL